MREEEKKRRRERRSEGGRERKGQKKRGRGKEKEGGREREGGGGREREVERGDESSHTCTAVCALILADMMRVEQVITQGPDSLACPYSVGSTLCSRHSEGGCP